MFPFEGSSERPRLREQIIRIYRSRVCLRIDGLWLEVAVSPANHGRFATPVMDQMTVNKVMDQLAIVGVLNRRQKS